MNMVMHMANGLPNVRLLVSETEFDRNMRWVVSGSKCAKTLTFPKTIREVLRDAFSDIPVRHVVLNEGLERLGECERHWDDFYGIFEHTKITRITLPATLTAL